MTDVNHDMVQLSGLLPEFSTDGYAIPQGVTNHRVWKSIVDGQLPAQKIGNRYWVRRADKPAYAAHFGMKLAVSAKPARKAASTPISVAA